MSEDTVCCNECGEKELDEVIECSECGMFCTSCYEKNANNWVIRFHPNHCRDLCPEHAYLANAS